MIRRLVLVLPVLAAFAVLGARGPQAAQAKSCSAGYVHAKLSWGEKCLKVGQYCKIKGDGEYHRYGFHCHTGRLSRSSAGGNSTGAGCQPGYSPCLPRVADLNCDDIPESKKPIRVTGTDPYRLDGDGDGWGCEPQMGYWRFQKRKQLAPGVRLNLSKRGPGLSLGPRGARVSVGPRGLGAAVTLLGTGLTYFWRQKKKR